MAVWTLPRPDCVVAFSADQAELMILRLALIASGRSEHCGSDARRAESLEVPIVRDLAFEPISW